MTFLSSILIKTGYKRVNEKWLNKQFARGKVDAIEYALRKGHYDVRQLAVEYLGDLDSKKSIPLLISTIDDPVSSVSEAAMNSLEKIGTDLATKSRIQEKRAYWKKHKSKVEIKDRSPENKFTPERKDRPSRKSFENLKQMLRKPMNSGKWF
ncbi:MAG: HEAT repeat domain-containing protein [Fluviicola sp.]